MNWIQAIKEDENAALKNMYSQYHDTVCSWLQAKFPISYNDSKEIFQLAVVILYDRFITGKLTVLPIDASSYLMGIAKNKAKEQYKKKSKFVNIEISDKVLYQQEDDGFENEHNDIIQHKITKIEKGMEDMGDPCKSILQMYYYKKMGMNTISKALNYKNADTAKNVKYKCIKRLQKMTIQHN